MPLFALANAGIVIDGELLGRAVTSPVTLGVVAAYVVGKRLRPHLAAVPHRRPTLADAARAGAARHGHGDRRPVHPHAQLAAEAAEAAGEQGAFWAMHDALFGDQGRLEDPHLWERAERLGLDVMQFDADRRSDRIAERVREQFRGGVRAGVVTTPTVFVDGERYSGRTAVAQWT